MSLSSNLMKELRAAVGQSNVTAHALDGQRSIRCHADCCEPLAVTVMSLVLETAELSAVSAFELQAASAELARRVNYLLEPIAPIETDSQGCTVQLRSNPPQHDDNGWKYYELLVRRGGSIELCRYEKLPGQPRVRVPAVLTHEVIGRLSDDFSATVDSI